MTVPAGRDNDLVDIVKTLRTQLADVTATMVGRWGRVPHLNADPASPPDGAVWIRSDLGKFCFRANGATIRVP